MSPDNKSRATNMRPLPGRFHFTETITDGDGVIKACDFIRARTGLSGTRVKDAMTKGAVSLKRKGLGRVRVRKASFVLAKGDTLSLHYDENILALVPPPAQCLKDYRRYSIWFKPSGLLSQGTDFGDHVSLLRQVEAFFSPGRKALPVHRLDREVSGLVMVAHSREAAGKLSRLFQDHTIVKRYRAEVSGIFENEEGVLNQPVDGKAAVTKYRVVSRNMETNTCTLHVAIATGRLHQIRRHLAEAGHPVMGDPRYGTGNKDGKPLRLAACELEWTCPFGHGRERFFMEGEGFSQPESRFPAGKTPLK